MPSIYDLFARIFKIDRYSRPYDRLDLAQTPIGHLWVADKHPGL